MEILLYISRRHPRAQLHSKEFLEYHLWQERILWLAFKTCFQRSAIFPAYKHKLRELAIKERCFAVGQIKVSLETSVMDSSNSPSFFILHGTEKYFNYFTKQQNVSKFWFWIDLFKILFLLYSMKIKIVIPFLWKGFEKTFENYQLLDFW